MIFKTRTLLLLLLTIFALYGLYKVYIYDTSDSETYKEEIKEDKDIKENVTFLFFLKKDEVNAVLGRNQTFYDSLTPSDLSARNVVTKEQYVEMSKEAGLDFERDEEELIRNSVGKAKRHLQRIKTPWFDGKEAAEIPWKFAVTQTFYEQGLPHTVEDVIILPKDFLARMKNGGDRFINTLVHEKVHVYQKLKGFDEYIRHHQIEKVKPREHSDMIRANPDLDGWVYKKDGRLYGAFYKSDTPSSILDVHLHEGSQRHEHPLEEMAILIADM
jgi:hypothetical protein